MIAYLDGKLAFKDPTYVIIDVAGVGYQVKISLYTFSNLRSEERCKLHTYLHIKEDAHTLYGFHDAEEKYIFTELISVSGVGPSTALMMLSSLQPSEIRHAIGSEDVRTIQGIKGIGAKTAQRLILELKDRIRKAEGAEKFPTLPIAHNTVRQEALSALVTLGYNKATAEKSIDIIIKRSGSDIKVEDLIRQVLKSS